MPLPALLMLPLSCHADYFLRCFDFLPFSPFSRVDYAAFRFA